MTKHNGKEIVEVDIVAGYGNVGGDSVKHACNAFLLGRGLSSVSELNEHGHRGTKGRRPGPYVKRVKREDLSRNRK